MDSPLSMQIQCSLCLSDFSDPVSLSCDHSFCLDCILGHVQACDGQSTCPECRRPYTTEDLRPCRLLRNITDAVREHLKVQRSQEDTEPIQTPKPSEDVLLCVEHEERLKLFCENDQKLVCVVCRDGQKHREHKFKPVKEASQIVKATVKGALGFLVKEDTELDHMTQKQATEVTKTQMRAKELSAQISDQFEEMHKFLRKKEEEVQKILADKQQENVEAMCKNMSRLNERLMTGKELECIFQSALSIDQPDHFLQWWSDKGIPITERMKSKDKAQADIVYKSRVNDLSVMPNSFFIGPIETHLQFFVWKEMLNAIKPVPDHLRIKETTDSYLKVSPEKSSVRQTDRQIKIFKDYNPSVVSSETFQNGQHYWELEVGKKLDWSVGITVQIQKKNRLTYKAKDIHLQLKHEKGYFLSADEKEIPIKIARAPSKIGLYLDCDRKQVTFYDADIMSQITQTSYISDLPCFVSLYPGIYLEGKNIDPITACSYGL